MRKTVHQNRFPVYPGSLVLFMAVVLTMFSACATLKQAYPWTQQGYTYDWGNPKSEVGISEFVIRKGSTVVIKSVSTLDQYCGSK